MNNTPRVAIVIPIYREIVARDEQSSLSHMKHFLSGFPQIVIQPLSLRRIPPGYKAIRFPDEYFLNVDSYSKLLLCPSFYASFLDYDYILIYQLDCLVFSNDLLAWCEMGYDYIGAPLFENKTNPPRISRVGNGGLSLRHVRAFLEVLNSKHMPALHEIFTVNLPDLNLVSGIARWIKKVRIIRDARRGVEWYTRNYSLNEDLFWSDRACLFYPSFKIAPLHVALRFAFDADPRICFEKNGHCLPFGAHAWTKWDRAFWEPYLIS